MSARLRSALMTPFASSHGRSARRICSESWIPSRSWRRRIASNRSASMRNVATGLTGVIETSLYYTTHTVVKSRSLFFGRVQKAQWLDGSGRRTTEFLLHAFRLGWIGHDLVL